MGVQVLGVWQPDTDCPLIEVLEHVPEGCDHRMTKGEYDALYDYITGRCLMEPPMVEDLVKKALRVIDREKLPES